MITNVREERLLITSDTHIGSYFCNARPHLVPFLEYAAAGGYNVCFNGDGIDVLHTSLRKITAETAALLADTQRVLQKYPALTIYYTVGNHDIILEHYMAEWSRMRLVPFLNVLSGDKRYRVEHGHLYDPFFIRHPDLQNAMTRFSYYLCRLHPAWYHWFKRYHTAKLRLKRRLFGGNVDETLIEGGEGPAFVEAAGELAQRGFDAVVFGHTHNENVLPLKGTEAVYYNTGSWFGQPYYVEIDHGAIALKPWRI
ncbi:MAG TPA: metallophosphoesterase [Vicinamibacterales bacterium]|nr:metallophosphoesterase [Vicinamibacterales bacterium]